jgi:hypothetical protein
MIARFKTQTEDLQAFEWHPEPKEKDLKCRSQFTDTSVDWFRPIR